MDNAELNVTELHDLVQERGLLVHRSDTNRVEFQFLYNGFPFAARAAAGNPQSDLEIRTALGYLPYTAEGGGRRQAALDFLASLKKVFGSKINLMSDMKLVLEDRRKMDGPLTPTNLLTEMVFILSEAKPHLDQLGQYLTPLQTQQVISGMTDDPESEVVAEVGAA